MQAASPSNLTLTGDNNVNNPAPATALGNMPTKVGHRVFQARLRLSF
jgi:hypothetical protein